MLRLSNSWSYRKPVLPLGEVREFLLGVQCHAVRRIRNEQELRNRPIPRDPRKVRVDSLIANKVLPLALLHAASEMDIKDAQDTLDLVAITLKSGDDLFTRMKMQKLGALPEVGALTRHLEERLRVTFVLLWRSCVMEEVLLVVFDDQILHNISRLSGT